MLSCSVDGGGGDGDAGGGHEATSDGALTVPSFILTKQPARILTQGCCFTYEGIEISPTSWQVIISPPWLLVWVAGSFSKQLLCVDSFFPLPPHSQQHLASLLCETHQTASHSRIWWGNRRDKVSARRQLPSSGKYGTIQKADHG